METLSTQVAVAAVISWLLQKIKGSSWFPFITAETEKINRIAAVVLSGLGTLGIVLACSSVERKCTLTWPDAATLAAGLWQWFTQFAILHGWWKVTKPNA